MQPKQSRRVPCSARSHLTGLYGRLPAGGHPGRWDTESVHSGGRYDPTWPLWALRQNCQVRIKPKTCSWGGWVQPLFSQNGFNSTDAPGVYHRENPIESGATPIVASKGALAFPLLGSSVSLDGAADAEFAHAGLERGALHAQQRGGAFGAGNAPLRLLEGAQDVLALGLFESGNRGG